MQAIEFSQNLFQKVSNGAYADPLGAMLWGICLPVEISCLHTSLSECYAAERLSSQDPEKIQKIWDTNKKFLEALASTASTLGLTLNWMHEVSILHLGAWLSPMKVFGYGGRAFVALSNLVTHSKSFIHDKSSTVAEDRGKTRRGMIEKLLTIAFYASYAAWGILGVAFSLMGGDFLFELVDAYLCYTVLLFTGKFAYHYFLTTREEQEKQLA